MRRELGDVAIEVVQGDIAHQPDVDAVVNAANAQLQPGGGVAGAIHRAAGPGLARECEPLAPIAPGECVITGAHELPNRHVLHCLGPVHGVDEPADQLLADCYRNALRLADSRALRSVAFPAISTGAFGFPLEPATRVALSTILAEIPHASHLRLVRMVLHAHAELDVHRDVLRDLLDGA